LPQKIKGEYFDPRFLLSAAFAWLVSALILLLLSSILLNELGCTEKSLGYTSSAISFAAAMIAGMAAGRKRKAGAVYTALLTASAMVTALLTIGFMINGNEIEASAVMSVISFSFAGCLVGVVMFTGSGKNKKRYRPKLN